MNKNPQSSFVRACCIALVALSGALACTPIAAPKADWPPLAKKWYERARTGFRTLDLADAKEAVGQALKLEADRAEVRELAARIALAQLDFPEALKHTEGLTSAKGKGLRARALWYSGKPELAVAALEEVLADPAVRDPWAEGTLKLARTGRGRSPYTVKGEMLAVMDMPRLQSTAMVVPVELNGQPVLALVSTTNTEVYIDSEGGREPGWVSLRFQERVELKDVPALTRDLSGISRELGAPIKLLIGTHALRHLNPTIDFLGRQFVVRTFVPPAPPVATKVEIHYIRGGAMAVRGRIGPSETASPFVFLLDSASAFPVVLDDDAWKRTSVAGTRQPVPGRASVSQALLPSLQLGAFSVPNVPAVGGVPTAEIEKELDIELDGLIGSGLLSSFRLTLTDGGRTLWLEDAPKPMVASQSAGPGAPPVRTETSQAAPAVPAATPDSAAPAKSATEPAGAK